MEAFLLYLKTKSKLKNLLLALLFLTVLTMGYLYSQEKGVSARRANMIALQQDSINIQRKAFVVNKDLLKELKKENEELKEATKDFKNVESYTKVKTITKIDTVTVYFGDDIPDFGILDVNIDSSLFSLSAVVSNKAFTLKSLEIPNQSQIIVGDKKIIGWTGITKGTEYQINIINSNPLVSNIDMQTYTIREEKKWYETRGFAAGVGLVGGLILFK
tara:strand:- start:1978 stop:2628 length:651 start_codon:yes stop_codon:yes gene_type:complete